MQINLVRLIYRKSHYDNIEDKQKFEVSLVTRPLTETQQIMVRVTFQRRAWDMNGNLCKLETLQDPAMYQGFFNKLSKSIFLDLQV